MSSISNINTGGEFTWFMLWEAFLETQKHIFQ